MTESELRSKRAGVKALAPTFISRCELSSALRQPHWTKGKNHSPRASCWLKKPLRALNHALNCRCTGQLTSRLTPKWRCLPGDRHFGRDELEVICQKA